MIGNIFWGLLGLGIAFAMVRFRRQIGEFTGAWGWAENRFGAGGTYTAIIFFAFALIVLSIMKLTGTFESTVNNSIGRFF